MADAIVLITTQADKVSEAAKKIVEIPGVKDVYSVAVLSCIPLTAPPHGGAVFLYAPIVIS